MRVEWYPNVSGIAGTERTIQAMRRLVLDGRRDPTVIVLAQQLARKHPAKDYHAHVEEMFDFVRRWVKYVHDPRGVETLRSPLLLLYHRAGDCDDQAILASALCEAVGLKTRFKAVKADSDMPDEFSHVYSQVEVPGEGWLTIDTIVPRAYVGWETDRQFGARVWPVEEGILDMFGDLGDGPIWAGLGAGPGAAPAAAPAAKAPAKPSKLRAMLSSIGNAFVGVMGDVVKDVGTQAADQILQNMALRKSPAPASGLGKLLPLLIALPVGVVAVVLLKRRKRK